MPISYKKITIGEENFYLVPCGEIDNIEVETNLASEYTAHKEIINDFPPVPEEIELEVVPQPGLIGRAVGVISDYRERFKQRKVKSSELRTTPTVPVIIKDPSERDFRAISQAAGEDSFFGDGIEIDD